REGRDGGVAAEPRVAPCELGEALAETGLGGELERPVVEEAVEVLGQVAGAGVAPGRARIEALPQDGVEAPGRVRAGRAERGGLLPLFAQESDRIQERHPRRRLLERGG